MRLPGVTPVLELATDILISGTGGSVGIMPPFTPFPVACSEVDSYTLRDHARGRGGGGQHLGLRDGSKCRTCAKQYLVDAPICHACHAHKTLTNRVSIRTELLFTFLMSGLKEAMGKAKRAKVLTPITIQPFTREMFGALRHDMTQRNRLGKELPTIIYSRKSVKGVHQHFWHLKLDEAWHLARTMRSATKDSSWPRAG